MTAQQTVFLAAGGTGGHVYPAIATAQTLHDSGHLPVLITDERGNAYAREWPGGYVYVLPAARFSTRRPLQLPKASLRLWKGIMQCRSLFKELNTASVIGFGGYPALPVGYAARMAGKPLILHEQNSVLGRSNRLLARHASAIALSYSRTRGVPDKLAPSTVVVGTPVRKQAFQEAQPYSPPEGRDAPWHLVVVGGSLGASVFSALIPSAVALLADPLRRRLRITQQVRKEDLKEVQQAYANMGMTPELAPFFQDMPQRLARCHLAICRSGASTMAELSVLGRPAVLIPYPHATGGHQLHNAAYYGEKGAAWILPQSRLTPEVLALKLNELLGTPGLLSTAAERMRKMAQPEAALTLGQMALRDTSE